ncbi:MAG: hypothetical protein AAB903_00480 [Patescibacteria group bacterium]
MEPRLPEEAVEQFRALIRDEFGVELAYAEAEQRAWEVLDLFWLLRTGEGLETERSA